ncbi:MULTISPECIES: winged helix-turn-helix domain-containing protein [unclassified Streptomyces]|uniref:winged helix-turn-helix domain-containing protein n=1 Tax=unclassified Streptomyces TaxID=2593676 RepID=UPI0037FA0D42
MIDAAIHHPTRLTVAAFLSACDEAEFAAVRSACQVSDSVLSKVAAALEEVGYLAIRKGYVGKRPRTWLSLTPTGRQALDRHIAALQNIATTAREAGARAQADLADRSTSQHSDDAADREPS